MDPTPTPKPSTLAILKANRPDQVLIEEALHHWPGQWLDLPGPEAPHEAGRLHLQIDKAHHQLG